METLEEPPERPRCHVKPSKTTYPPEEVLILGGPPEPPQV